MTVVTIPTPSTRPMPLCGRRRANVILWLIGAFWALGLMGPSSTMGYVLQGPHVLELMVRQLAGAGAERLRIRQQVTIEDNTISDHSVALFETLSFIFPNRFRSDAWYRGTNRIQVVSSGQALTVIDGKITADRESRFDRYKDLFLYQSRKAVHKMLLANGVDVAIASLGRMDDQIAYVIGAQYPDESASQVWVDKEQFLPLRWVTVQPALTPTQKPDRLEFVYRNWQKIGNFWYPKQIASYHNQRLIRLIEMQDAQIDADFAADLFNIPYLMSIYTPAEPAAPEQTPSSDDEVQRTIEEFRKKFEP